MSFTSREPVFTSEILADEGSSAQTYGSAKSGHKFINRRGDLTAVNGDTTEYPVSRNVVTNYVKNTSADSSIVTSGAPWGWASSNATNLAVSRSTTGQPRNATHPAGIKIAGTGNDETGVYVYYDFTLDDVDANGTIMQISWDQKIAGAYTAGQLEVYIADQASRGTILATPFTQSIAAATGTFTTYFISPTTTSLSLVIRATANMTSLAGIILDNVFVGRQVTIQGSAIGAWKAFTQSSSGWSSNVTYSTAYYREVGSSVEIRSDLQITGATSGGLDFTQSQLFGSLTGYSIDTTSLSGSSTSKVPIGYWTIHDSSPSVAYSGVAFWNKATSKMLFGIAASDFVSSSSPITFASGDRFSFTVSIPVNELSANVTLANRAVEEYAADDGSADVFGPNGALVPNQAIGTQVTRVFTLPSTAQQTDFSVLEYKGSNGNWQVCADVFPFVQQGAKNYGVRGYWSSSTQYTVVFGAGGTIADNATYANNGSTAWSSAYALGERFRLRKVSGGAVVGYPISSANIIGRTDGVAPAAGMVGEIKESFLGSNVTLGTSNTDIISGAQALSLTAGVWRVSYSASVGITNNSSASSSSRAAIWLSTSTPTVISGTSTRIYPNAGASLYFEGPVSSEAIVNITSTTSYILRGLRQDIVNAGTATVLQCADNASSTWIRAVRIA